MKIAISTLFLLLSVQLCLAQTFTIQHDGITRTYRLYAPPSYNPANPTPLVLNFHGFGSTASEQQFYTLIDNIATSENFITVYPSGIANAWNSGAVNGSLADDVGFVSNMIDSIGVDFNIDTDRVYATGMSNGGFMSFRLACELEDKIAAIASVTGMMANTVIPTCQTNRPVPTMLIHGTADAVVNYNGLPGYYVGAEASVAHWVQANNCTASPVITNLPNIDLTDLSTATHYYYGGCDNGTEVEFYKITGGGHTWPDAAINIPGDVTNRDFNASEKIWEFFNRHSLNGPISSSEDLAPTSFFEISPNPFSDQVFVSVDQNQPFEVIVQDMMGRVVVQSQKTNAQFSIDTKLFAQGMYLLTIKGEQGQFSKKIIKQ